MDIHLINLPVSKQRQVYSAIGKISEQWVIL
jgi:hypothetical protein